MAYDKKLHFAAGLIIAITCGFIFNAYDALLAAFCAGIGKEIYDLCDYGKFDWLDMVVTWLGGFVGFLILKALETL